MQKKAAAAQACLFDELDLEVHGSNINDIVYTPDRVARTILEHFAPKGVLLDPCRGDGAFHKYMAGAQYCEILEGKDFFKWTAPVDWIISNPPYSIYRDWLLHSFEVADNIVYLIPISKAFTTSALLDATLEFGGIAEVLYLGSARDMGFDLGFAMGAVHYQRGYKGPTTYRRVIT